MRETNYRPDIDGLRAFAVIAVLIFHAFPNHLPGGFIGVDVFFVISGYLITGILLNESVSGGIRLFGFYARRVRRIFPALILVLATSFLIGWSIFLPSEFAQICEHIVASATFTINIVLWREVGYFDNAAITKPLLHMWSLGVEEQFYIVWPLLLIIIRKSSRRVLPQIVALLIISFAINIFQTRVDPSGAFFLPASRAWELLLGALLAAIKVERLAIPKVLRVLSALIGSAFLAISVILIRESGFPGWQAILPVLGSGLIISAGRDNLVNLSVLSNRPMIYIGKISYPLYLWHWPLLSFARISTQSEISAFQAAAILCLSIILAGATHALIERRVAKLKPNAILSGSLVGMMLVVASFAGIAARSDGRWSRIAYNNRVDLGFDGGWPQSVRKCSFTSNEDDKLLSCYIDETEDPRFALIGDSKAGALFKGIFRNSSPGGRWVYFGSGGGGPLLAVSTQDPAYAWYNQKLPEAAYRYTRGMANIDAVVIAAAARALFHIPNDDSLEALPSTPYYESALSAFDGYISKFVESGKRVILVSDNPTLPHIEDCVNRMTGRWWIFGGGPNRNCNLTFSEHRRRTAPYLKMLDAIAARHQGAVSIIHTDALLCDKSANQCPVFSNGRPLYGFTDHISDYASTIVGSELNSILAVRRRTVSPRPAGK